MIEFVLASYVDIFIEFINPANLLGIIIKGLAGASLYIMIASGLSIIFGLMGVLNIAHGSLTMLGAYLGGLFMILFVGEGMSDPLLMLVFFAGVAFVFGTLTLGGSALEIKLIRPLYDRNPIYQILLTFGLTLVINEAARMVLQVFGISPVSPWNDARLSTIPGFLQQSYDFAGTTVLGLEFFEILFGILVVGAIWVFLNRTRYGLFIRAGSEDDEMAEALGINVRRAFTVVFGLGVGVAGVAGIFLMWDQTWGATVTLALDTLLPAFVVVIIGGLGSFRGTVAAGVIVGLVDEAMTWWAQRPEIGFSGLPDLAIFLILLVVLAVRPQGIFGEEEGVRSY